MQIFISSPTINQLEPLKHDHQINEGREYDLVLRPNEGEELDTSELDSSRLCRLKIVTKRQRTPGSREERYTINFRNYVGTAHILGHRISVTSEKLGDDGVEQMLAQITENVASLPFDFNSPTYESFEMAAEMPRTILYHCFTYLRYIMHDAGDLERLSTCVLTVLLSMKRELERRVVTENIMSGRVDSSTLGEIARSPSNLVEIVDQQSPIYDLALAQRLVSRSGRRYIPSQIQIQRSFTTVDTPENRFVKYFLERCNDIVLHFRDILVAEPGQYVDPTLEEDCEKMTREISYYLSFPVLRDVGPMRVLPMGSTTLQKRGGYREILGHFSRMNLGARYPISGQDLESIIEDKDIAKLYEYWCYFKIAAAIRDILNREPTSAQSIEKITEKGVHLRQGPSLEWRMSGTNLKLAYNPYFPGKTLNHSYSLGLRPDFTLTMDSSLYLFDAKFKIVTIDKQPSEKEVEDQEREEDISSTFTNGDIYKMHTYRDAIHGVKAAFILYPGHQEEFRFYEAEGGTPTERSTAEDVERMLGVGAIPLRPPHLGEATLDQLLARILSICMIGLNSVRD